MSAKVSKATIGWPSLFISGVVGVAAGSNFFRDDLTYPIIIAVVIIATWRLTTTRTAKHPDPPAPERT